MNTKFKGILTLLLAFVVHTTFAQEKTVSGTVSDVSGVLPGVSIIIEGTKTGTETDFDGKYQIKANEGDVLVFRYLGYTTLTKTIGSSEIINVTLNEGSEMLNEITIGLGVSKKEKAIGYAVQKVSGEDINKAKEPNLVNSLQGRIAGVQIQGSPSTLNLYLLLMEFQLVTQNILQALNKEVSEVVPMTTVMRHQKSIHQTWKLCLF